MAMNRLFRCGRASAWVCGIVVAVALDARAQLVEADGNPTTTDLVEAATGTAPMSDNAAVGRAAGIVTLRHDQPDRDRIALVIQDEGRATWVMVPHRAFSERGPGFADVPSDLGPGHRIVVEGDDDHDSFAPRLRASSLTVTGTAALPKAMLAESSGFFRGDGGPVRTMVRGIVQSVRRDKGICTLALDVDGRRVTVRGGSPPDAGVAEHMIDASVRITGVAGAIRNTRGQFLGPLLVINSFKDVERVTGPPTTAFETPFVPLSEIARYGSQSLGGHRFQTEGTVTRSLATRYLFLQDGDVGIRVETSDRENYAPGDRVRVAGFLDAGRQLRGLVGAVTRRVGHGPAPEPIPTTPARIAGGDPPAGSGQPASTRTDFAGRLVTFTATVADAGPTRDGGVLRLANDRTILEAVLLPDAYQTAAAFAAGSEVSVTGIVQYDVTRQHEELVDGRLHPFDRFTLYVHNASDLRLLRAAPWWTPVRLTAALAAVLAVLAAALAWAWSLRRQVAFQAAAIAKEMRARREAAVEFQATLRERTRLAANLHDTLLQSMAGIGFQLEACQMSARRAGDDDRADAAEHLDVARRMVDHAVADIRGSVWALRTASVHGRSLTEAIEALVARAGAGHRARIEFETTGEPFQLPNFVTGNLLLIVQESVFNAIRHGNPDCVDVGIAFRVHDGSVELSIRDDGAGFVVGAQRGPEQGHFGLQGMRERAERLGGRLTVQSLPGNGTLVRCEVRCRDYDPEIERDEGLIVAPPLGAEAP